MSNANTIARQRDTASCPAAEATNFNLRSIEPPPGRSTIWSGKAVFADVTYEWFYDTDSSRFWVRSEKTVGSGFWFNVETPPCLQTEVVRCIKAEAGGLS